VAKAPTKIGKVKMTPCIVVVKNGLVDEITIIENGDEERHFLEKCQESVSNWDEFTAEDISNVLSDGYVERVNGTICLAWAEKV
jgi:hypothetical protein